MPLQNRRFLGRDPTSAAAIVSQMVVCGLQLISAAAADVAVFMNWGFYLEVLARVILLFWAQIS